jgi:hypothetical protein
MFKIGTFLGVLWMINVIAYFISAYFFIEYMMYPIIFVAFLLIYLINPIRIMKQSSRFWLIRILVTILISKFSNLNTFFLLFQWRVFSAPFHKVQFADFWLADQLTSFEFLFVDVQYIFCYYLMEAKWAPFRRMFH